MAESPPKAVGGDPVNLIQVMLAKEARQLSLFPLPVTRHLSLVT